MNLTFKKEPKETGLAAVSRPYSNSQIKLDGKVVGTINAPFARRLGGEDKWSIKLAVVSENVAGFSWRTFKCRFETDKDAREWIKSNIDEIASKLNIYRFEEW